MWEAIFCSLFARTDSIVQSTLAAAKAPSREMIDLKREFAPNGLEHLVL